MDEFQFFTNYEKNSEEYFLDEENLNTIIRWKNEFKKIVIVAGLKANFQKKKFGLILDLIPEADKVELKLHFVHFVKVLLMLSHSRRIIDENGNVIRVGGLKKYKPCCEYHFKMPFQILKKIKINNTFVI